MGSGKEEPMENSPLTLFGQGLNDRAFDYMGVHRVIKDGAECMSCRVWAPSAVAASVVGDFNHWDTEKNPMQMIGGGVWECYLPFVLPQFENYKFFLETAEGKELFKSDPYAFHCEMRPGNASKYCEIDGYPWKDAAWMRHKVAKPHYTQPVNIYEVHPGSWRRFQDGNVFSYDRLADELIALQISS